jgi:hypothetical protein
MVFGAYCSLPVPCGWGEPLMAQFFWTQLPLSCMADGYSRYRFQYFHFTGVNQTLHAAHDIVGLEFGLLIRQRLTLQGAQHLVPETMEPTRPRVREKLAWLIPVLIASGLFAAICLNPTAFMKDHVFFPLIIIYGLVAPLGGLWAIYQSIRYETHPWKYVAVVVVVPFGFVWYYFERYIKRGSETEVGNS